MADITSVAKALHDRLGGILEYQPVSVDGRSMVLLLTAFPSVTG